jgi:hypothetical protein
MSARRPWTPWDLLFYVVWVNSSPHSMAAPVLSGADRSPDASSSSTSPGSDAIAARCVAGEPVTDDLIAAITDLEQALDKARLDGAEARRRLRFHQDHVDDELAAALARCRQLEGEKLAAFGLDRPSDADVFRPEPASPVAALTWHGLRSQLEAQHRAALDAQAHAFAERHETQARELAARYLGELQENSLANATAMQRQAQQWQAKLDGEARRWAEDAERAAAERDGAAQRDGLEHRIGALEEALRRSQADADAAHRHVHALLTSTSWRAARPLRGVSRVVQWLKGR